MYLKLGDILILCTVMVKGRHLTDELTKKKVTNFTKSSCLNFIGVTKKKLRCSKNQSGMLIESLSAYNGKA